MTYPQIKSIVYHFTQGLGSVLELGWEGMHVCFHWHLCVGLYASGHMDHESVFLSLGIRSA